MSTTAAANLSESEAMAAIDAMRTAADIKAALKAQWLSNAPGARFSVLGAYLRQRGVR